MNEHSIVSNRGRSMSPLVYAKICGTACAALASACSGDYPLGYRADIAPPLEGNGGSETGDASVPAWLAPPEITITESFDEPGPTTLAAVGDLDGDGRDEMAVSGVDHTLGLAFVQLRYGGARPVDDEQKFAFAHGGAFLTLPLDQPLSVAAAGDVDGDGHADLLVQTMDCDTTEPYEGNYLVYGGPERLTGSVSLTSVATRFVPSAREASPPPGYGLSCGTSLPLSAAGDIDGDGIDDLVLQREPITDTSSGNAIFGTGEGIYVFYGRAERFASEVELESADATFHINERVTAYAYGDIDGDGLAELIVSPDAYRRPLPGSYLLRGRGERWSGAWDLADGATLLAGAYVTTSGWLSTPGDLDGDGLTDVLLFDADFGRHLFYGAPALFAAGVDFAAADATLGATAGFVFSVGDRDGDGDDELVDRFSNPNETELLASIFSSNLAFTSGSPERLSGIVPFPEDEVTAQFPEGPFPDQKVPSAGIGRTLTYAIPAGDLDGDGAADLFTTSMQYEVLGDSGYQQSRPEIHIHFGVRAQGDVNVR